MTKLISILLIIAAFTACANSKASNEIFRKYYNKEQIIAWNEDTIMTCQFEIRSHSNFTYLVSTLDSNGIKRQKIYNGTFKFLDNKIFLRYHHDIKPANVQNFLIREITGQYLIQDFIDGRKRMYMRIVRPPRFRHQSLFLAPTPPNYTGTWVLNLEKSQLEDRPEGLTSTVFIIKQDGDKFSLTRYHIFGEKKKKISFKMVADGKTRKVKVLFKGKLERNENNLQATLWRKNFLNIVNYKFGINQNELIADEVYTSKANKHHNIWVFNREIPK